MLDAPGFKAELDAELAEQKWCKRLDLTGAREPDGWLAQDAKARQAGSLSL